MYEKSGKFGMTNLVIHENEFDLDGALYRFFLAGWHRCNDLYHMYRCEEQNNLEDNYLLLSTVSGKGILRTEDGEYILTANTVALMDCQKKSEYFTAPDNLWEFYFIHFNQGGMKQIYDYLHKRGKLVESFSNVSSISHSIENIINIKNSYQTDIEFKVSRMISDAIHEMLDESLETYRPDPLITEIIRYMREHYAEKLELKDLAEQFYISKNYLCSIFKKHLQQSPYSYLTKIRIEESKKMLVGTDYPVNVIATKCGFSTPNNFIATYKRFEGITPNKYRKRANSAYPKL